MDWYAIFKFLHVASAVCWVGGGLVLVVLGIMAERKRDTPEMMHVVGQVARLSMAWFIPTSVLTVVFGVVVASIGNLWADAWVLIGLVGFAATFSTGNFVLKPTAEKIDKLTAGGRGDEALPEGKKLLEVAKFDYVMLFTVIADMVLKPSWSDVVLLVIMAVVIVAGTVVFLVPALRGSSAIPA